MHKKTERIFNEALALARKIGITISLSEKKYCIETSCFDCKKKITPKLAGAIKSLRKYIPLRCTICRNQHNQKKTLHAHKRRSVEELTEHINKMSSEYSRAIWLDKQIGNKIYVFTPCDYCGTEKRIEKNELKQKLNYGEKIRHQSCANKMAGRGKRLSEEKQKKILSTLQEERRIVWLGVPKTTTTEDTLCNLKTTFYKIEEIKKIKLFFEKKYGSVSDSYYWAQNNGIVWSVFKAAWINVVNNKSNCPNFNPYINEHYAKIAAKKLFPSGMFRFNYDKYSFLLSPKGNPLEIDVVIETGIVVENTPAPIILWVERQSNLHDNPKVQEKDAIKVRVAQERAHEGFRLIAIPKELEGFSAIYTYLYNECVSLNLLSPEEKNRLKEVPKLSIKDWQSIILYAKCEILCKILAFINKGRYAINTKDIEIEFGLKDYDAYHLVNKLVDFGLVEKNRYSHREVYYTPKGIGKKLKKDSHTGIKQKLLSLLEKDKEKVWTNPELAIELAVEIKYLETFISRLCRHGIIKRVGYGKYKHKAPNDSEENYSKKQERLDIIAKLRGLKRPFTLNDLAKIRECTKQNANDYLHRHLRKEIITLSQGKRGKAATYTFITE